MSDLQPRQVFVGTAGVKGRSLFIVLACLLNYPDAPGTIGPEF